MHCTYQLKIKRYPVTTTLKAIRYQITCFRGRDKWGSLKTLRYIETIVAEEKKKVVGDRNKIEKGMSETYSR